MPAKVEKAPPPKNLARNLILLVVVGLLASAAGFAVPFFLPVGAGEKTSHPEEKKPAPNEPTIAYVPFGEVTVNPSDSNYQRYLHVKMTLVVEPAQEAVVKERIESKMPHLRNWLITYLSDMSIKDVAGGAGKNRARREIQDQFNTILFPDGSERIRDVLFTDFNLQ